MVFSELTSEQQARALSDLVRFLAENNCSSLDAAAARLGQSPQQIWARLLNDAGAPETEIPRNKIGARSSRFHQKRTVSWQMSTPRSNRRSSTCRNDSGYRMYNITARRITAGELLK